MRRRTVNTAFVCVTALIATFAIAPNIAAAAIPAPIARPSACGVSSYTGGGMMSTARPAFHSDCPSYKGWGTLSTISANSCLFQGCMMPSPPADGPVAAYFWTGTAWKTYSLRGDSTAYAYPFATGWSWAYVGGYWYAVRSVDLKITPVIFEA